MRRSLLPFLFLLTACTCMPFSIDWGSGPPAAGSTPVDIYALDAASLDEVGQLARQHLEALTAIGPRLAGSQEESRAAEYIAYVLSSAGYSPEVQWFTALDYYEEEMVDSANVVAVRDGESTQEIIVGAHYDSSNEGLGADDNASGVAVLLEVAEQVAQANLPYTVRFIAFGAEEAGFLGSAVYVEQMDESERAHTLVMINLDSLVAGDIPYVYSDEGEDAAARDWMLAWAEDNGLGLQTIRNVDLADEDGYGTSDYDSFRSVGIPWAYLESTNWNLGDQDGYTQVDPRYGDEGAIIHTQYDTLAYIDSTFPGRVDEHLNLYVSVLCDFLTYYPPSP